MAYRRPAIVLAVLVLAGCASYQQASESLTAAHGDPAISPSHPTPHLSAFRPAIPPRGFSEICGTYPWACGTGPGIGAGTITDDAGILAAARRVNARVNRRIRPISDADQFGVAERWTLPASGAGDCEDYALLKLKELIAAGVPANRLFMAQVMPPDRSQHVVLVVRTASGDFVLDNLRSGIRPWHETGYSFLKMQNRERPGGWDVVLLGPRTRRY